MPPPRVWAWVPDMNGDGRVSVRDVWPWAKWLFLYPGDFAIYVLLERVPVAARFLELGPASYGGALAVALSIVAWTLPLALLLRWKAGFDDWRRRPRRRPPLFPDDD